MFAADVAGGVAGVAGIAEAVVATAALGLGLGMCLVTETTATLATAKADSVANADAVASRGVRPSQCRVGGWGVDASTRQRAICGDGSTVSARRRIVGPALWSSIEEIPRELTESLNRTRGSRRRRLRRHPEDGPHLIERQVCSVPKADQESFPFA